MKLTFLGDIKKLEKCVLRTAIPGKWRKIPNHQVQYRTVDDAILNWWESTGTVAFQGPKQAVKKLKKAFVKIALKKGLIDDERDADDEIADLKRQLKGALVEIIELKRGQKSMRIDITELKEAAPRN
jgi:hypothetical protein